MLTIQDEKRDARWGRTSRSGHYSNIGVRDEEAYSVPFSGPIINNVLGGDA